MKKWLGIFAGAYILGGAIYFGFQGSNGETSTPIQQSTLSTGAVDKPVNFHMAWFVDRPGNGNFEPPYWLEKPELVDQVKETSHDTEHAKATSPEYQLLTFFSYIQLGPAKDLNSFINPDIAYQDIKTKDMNGIEKILGTYRDEISRGKTIKEVYLTSPNEADTVVSYDVTIVYEDGKLIKLPSIQLLSQNEIGNWFINMKLSEIANSIRESS
ncbi:hypothetical protein [Brevibacillus sp. 179-C9.3 HS]|uniref:hypothetical protein n=1 Tax=unclassified Brevibacillus TaxID=2684853 RepID=UPI0039A28D9B